MFIVHHLSPVHTNTRKVLTELETTYDVAQRSGCTLGTICHNQYAVLSVCKQSTPMQLAKTLCQTQTFMI